MSKTTPEMLKESLADNLKRQEAFYEEVLVWMRANGFGSVRSSVESAGESPELVMATTRNFVLNELDAWDENGHLAALRKTVATNASEGVFMLGFYCGHKSKK